MPSSKPSSRSSSRGATPPRTTSSRHGTPSRDPSPARRTPSPSSVYEVYLVEYLGQPNHEAIFVETNSPAAGDGIMFHVIGNILAGMTYESKRGRRPETSATYVRKTHLGSIKTSHFDMVDQICRGIPAPGKQMKLNGRPIDPSKPLYRCGDWARDAISALRSNGVLRSH